MRIKNIIFLAFLIFMIPFFYNCYKEYVINRSDKDKLCGVYIEEDILEINGSRSSNTVSFFKIFVKDQSRYYYFLKNPTRYSPVYILGKSKKFEGLYNIKNGDFICVIYSKEYFESYKLDHNFPFIFDASKK